MKRFWYLMAFIVACFSAPEVSAGCPDGEPADSVRVLSTDLPTVSVYFFQNQYLSVVAPMITWEEGHMLAHPEILNTAMANANGFSSPFRDDEIIVDEIQDGCQRVYVWQFPEPHHLREALYIVFFPVDEAYKAVAISVGAMVDWEISTSTTSSRATFGRIKKPESSEECFRLLKERNADKPIITPGEFIQDGYVAPGYAL